MSVEKLLDGMDEKQKKAVTLQTNGVVSAGAGSGKTRVLASRYAWLVVEKNLKPEDILTLTFTNKAVSEMYSRIHRYLLEQAGADTEGESSINTRAADALNNFHKAKINTLDSFSANIARTAAARYGVSSDFSIDDTALRDLAREAALRFVLDNREAPAIRELLVDHKIRKLAEEIFAQTVSRHSSISNPLKLDETLLKQKEEIVNAWRKNVRLVEEITSNIIDALRALAEIKKSIKFTKSLEEILLTSPPPPLPDIAPLLAAGDTSANTDWNADLPSSEIRQRVKSYFDYYSTLMAIRAPGNYGDNYTPLVEYFRLLKGKDGDGLYHTLESIANYALNFGLCSGVFELIEEFQNEFNAKKRASGFLSFNDIARLAVDALKDHPDIRKAYKDSIRVIMIDEFQDNNALQRDLIYLLAENSERTGKGNPVPEELENDRMFFVGDEKQSIYRFRGADVAVFRSLGKDLFYQYGGGSLELAHNYRSRPALIAAFNHIFASVFLPPGPETPDYEAAHSPILPPEKRDDDRGDESGDGEKPLARFCFLNKEEMPEDDGGGIKSHDLEAAFIAGKIREMVREKEKIPKRDGGETRWTECTWGDFAVLQRSYTHQGTLEKYFREFGIPYNTDRPSGLFNDAPILDLRAYLRLLVYPEDRVAYASLIRSPFARLSDLSLAVCMLGANARGEHFVPFAEENEPLIPEDDLALYQRARERYRYFRKISRTLPVTELVTKLWFEEGYRYETLWSESAQVYEGLFDLFFSLASENDRRGKSLAEFIEYLDDVMNREEKPDDKDIPGEGEAGVRIMSIHKSKGLEFPVVFVYDCAHSGNTRASSSLVSFHERYGVILNIPQAEELPLGGNYFRGILLEEEKAKDIAELRRLLYVAMTRAEYKLFLTFTLPKQTITEKEECDLSDKEFTEEIIRQRLTRLDEKSESKKDTFLKLLASPLAACPSSLCGLETIPVLTRTEIQKRAKYAALASGDEKEKNDGRNLVQQPLINAQREAALTAAPFYETAEILGEGKAGPSSLEASKLSARYKELTLNSSRGGAEARRNSGSRENTSDALDTLLEKAGLTPMEFGTLVHAVLEARLRRHPCFISPKIRSCVDDEKILQKLTAQAEILAEGFLVSELGKRLSVSNYHEPEFSVITSVVVEEKSIAITGQIDILFEEGDEIVVVDFKTDRIENPEDHYGQLAAYYRAAADIFAKPVSVWLFYLRGGRAVNVTKSVESISLEKLAATALKPDTAD